MVIFIPPISIKYQSNPIDCIWLNSQIYITFSQLYKMDNQCIESLYLEKNMVQF